MQYEQKICNKYLRNLRYQKIVICDINQANTNPNTKTLLYNLKPKCMWLENTILNCMCLLNIKEKKKKISTIKNSKHTTS